MQIIEKVGNIFDCDQNILVNPVNCVGTWGAGLAKQFASKFPETYKLYLAEFKAGFLRPGYCVINRENYKTIICFPTKDHWMDPSKLEYIRWGMHYLIEYLRHELMSDYEDIRRYDPKTQKFSVEIAMPRLGCGLGGLDWDEVKEVLQEFKDFLPRFSSDVSLFIYNPK